MNAPIGSGDEASGIVPTATNTKLSVGPSKPVAMTAHGTETADGSVRSGWNRTTRNSYSIFIGFKGGRGVVTGFGATVVATPLAPILMLVAFGIGAVVIKTRLLYLAGETRIHLDSVAGLGSFVELEVVLAPGQSAEDGRRVAHELMSALEIEQADLIDRAYADLLGA